MGSPPQGYVANVLATGGFLSAIDSLSSLGIFTPDGNESVAFEGSTNGDIAILGRNVTTSKRLISLGARAANAQSYLGFWSANNEIFFDVRAPQTQFTVDVNGIGVFRVQSDGLRLITGKVVQFPDATGTAANTSGFGLAPIFGLDNRSGITAADGSPIVLYAVPAGANQLFDAAIEIDATAFTSATATYTMPYTENGVSQTIPVTATVINVVSGVRRLIQPDPSTNITVQLTGAFVATVRLSAAVMQLA